MKLPLEPLKTAHRGYVIGVVLDAAADAAKTVIMGAVGTCRAWL
jgi:hypothetical protein